MKYLWIAAEPSLGLIMRLLWAAVLVLPVFGVQAGVVYTSLYSFSGSDGANPLAGLVQRSDGYFYGTTAGGGTNNYGTVFKISTNGALTSLYSFTFGSDGASPYAGLVQGTDGYFYGTTLSTVFRISTNGVLSTLRSFTGVYDGANLQAGLVQGIDGSFYGTTQEGGIYAAQASDGYGTVFRISANRVYTNLCSLMGTNGANPDAGLVQGRDGNFYGTTVNGGTNGVANSGPGTVFKISTNGALTSLYSFTGGSDGGWPYAVLVQGSDDYFYGTTSGTVFKISTNGALTNLHFFITIDGSQPLAGLVQGNDGYFYGTTYSGGTNNLGTVFRISSKGAFTSLYSFTGGTDGRYPQAALVQGSDGSFYGTTRLGGTNNLGTVFRLTIVPPQLTITPSGTNVVLSWPTNYAGFTAGFILQSTTNLGSSAVWSTNSSPPVVIGGENVVINAMSGRQQFFRLSQ